VANIILTYTIFFEIFSRAVVSFFNSLILSNCGTLQKVHEMLKKGWDAEGSPFKGQEFDPKMFNISPGAVGE